MRMCVTIDGHTVNVSQTVSKRFYCLSSWLRFRNIPIHEMRHVVRSNKVKFHQVKFTIFDERMSVRVNALLTCRSCEKTTKQKYATNVRRETSRLLMDSSCEGQKLIFYCAVTAFSAIVIAKQPYVMYATMSTNQEKTQKTKTNTYTGLITD